MRNLFVLLSSSKMVAQTRVYGIMYFAFCISLCWLAGRMQELRSYPKDTPQDAQRGGSFNSSGAH